MPSTIAYALHVTLGYGSNEKLEQNLNNACIGPPPPTTNTSTFSLFGGSGSSTSIFGKNTNNSNNNNSGNLPSSGVFVSSASAVRMSFDHQITTTTTTTKTFITTSSQSIPTPHLAALFVPPSIIDASLQKFTAKKVHASGSCFWVDETEASQFTDDLLAQVHPILKEWIIRGIILTSIASEQNAPAEIVLLDLKSQNNVNITDLMNATNGKGFSIIPDAIIKILPICSVKFSSFQQQQQQQSSSLSSSLSLSKNYYDSPITSYDIPTCPVCLHRIDPLCLGLPRPSNQDLCSKFCPAPSLTWGTWMSDTNNDACPRQQFLRRWPQPSRCAACLVIHKYWSDSQESTSQQHYQHDDESNNNNDLFCIQCALRETLWVCLTCGFVGCGRYSNKHSVAHFKESGHPYSLELATLRIWDYVDGEHGEFAHRVDLLDCPSSPPLAQPWTSRNRLGMAAASSSLLLLGSGSHDFSSHLSNAATSRSGGIAGSGGGGGIDDAKSPKKATMIGEEYEALLQSALEEQAQHYEGEIIRLRATLTAELVDQSNITLSEQREIDELRNDIAQLRNDIDHAGRELLDAQAQEAGYRATSQRLLREQQVAKDLLEKIQLEAKREHEQGKMQVDDLEQQLADLTANLKMRQQFSQSEELSNAQIFGTTGTTTSSNNKSNKRGKKQRRFFRK